MTGQTTDASKIVIDQPHVHTLLGFPFQHITDGSPHISIRNDKIFHENILFCLFQFFHQRRQHIVAHCKVFGLHIAIKGITCIIANISRLIGVFLTFLLQHGTYSGIFFRMCIGIQLEFFKLFLHLACYGRTAKQKIDQNTKNRHNKDQYCPGQFICRIRPFIYQIQHENKVQNLHCKINILGIAAQIPQQDSHPHNLQKDCEHHYKYPVCQ